MLRGVLGMAALGVAGLFAWKLMVGFVLPLFIGLVALVLKIAFWCVIIALAIWLFKKLSQDSASTA